MGLGKRDPDARAEDASWRMHRTAATHAPPVKAIYKRESQAADRGVARSHNVARRYSLRVSHGKPRNVKGGRPSRVVTGRVGGEKEM